MHSSDVSVPCRDFKIVKKWTYLLFEEFFLQGDEEKAKSLQVSFLCDRDTTNVAKSQPGFISFIVLPLFSILSDYMPNMRLALDGASNSKTLWETYTESEEDK